MDQGGGLIPSKDAMAGPVHYEIYIRKTPPASWSLSMATEDRKTAIETAEDLLRDGQACAVRDDQILSLGMRMPGRSRPGFKRDVRGGRVDGKPQTAVVHPRAQHRQESRGGGRWPGRIGLCFYFGTPRP